VGGRQTWEGEGSWLVTGWMKWETRDLILRAGSSDMKVQESTVHCQLGVLHISLPYSSDTLIEQSVNSDSPSLKTQRVVFEAIEKANRINIIDGIVYSLERSTKETPKE
jgi:hypothetical protein